MNDLFSEPSTEGELDEIYQAYPRHIGKRDAIRAIEKAIQRLKAGEYKGRSLSRIQAIAGLKNRAIMFSQSAAGKKKDFTPHPATWFNRSSYLDDPKEWQDQKANGMDEFFTKYRANHHEAN